MAMRVENVENLVANTNQNEGRIGQLFWYMISEGHTEQFITMTAFKRSGLPDEYKLPVIRAADAYRRASKSIEGRQTWDNGQKIELLVRDVWHNKDEVVRYLVVETRDVNGRRLKYDPMAAVLRFDHNHKSIDVDLINPEPYVCVATERFEQNFELFLTTYDGAAKRRTVRAVLNDLSAASLKDSGGVYLVPRQNEELLFSLVAFINGLPGCKAYRMPVQDTEEARDVVRDAVTNKAETILKEIRATLHADEITDLTVQALLARARSVRREVAMYQEVLRESIGTLETDVEILEAQMLNLVQQL